MKAFADETKRKQLKELRVLDIKGKTVSTGRFFRFFETVSISRKSA